MCTAVCEFCSGLTASVDEIVKCSLSLATLIALIAIEVKSCMVVCMTCSCQAP